MDEITMSEIQNTSLLGIKKAIAEALGICNRSLNDKLNGRIPFTWDEIKQMRGQFSWI